MKKLLFSVVLTLLTALAVAQVNPVLNQLVINVTAEVKESPPAIILHWENSTATGDDFQIRRKSPDSANWEQLAIVSSNDTSYEDADVQIGMEYEYRLLKRNNTFPVSWGYTSSGIKSLPRFINRGTILVLDTVVTDSLQPDIETFKNDLRAEGYVVYVIETDRAASVASVKSRIISLYNSTDDEINCLITIGHVPVPYSGNLNPDAHTNHKGAWPSDIYYGDIDGNWTDNSVNNVSGSSTRTHNVPGDGKFDQSIIPSAVELEVGRIDFYDLPTFADDEIGLLKKYFKKNHEFRTKQFVPSRRGVMDEGSFATNAAGEGFGQSGPRAMIPLLGRNNFEINDYFTALKAGSYLWSYGQGAGSYTNCNGIGSTADFASDSLQGVFTMLFGSYFGDYDSKNNLMRASLASGTILTCSWSSSRPIWYYHHMAMGHNIGYSAVQSLNYDNRYNFIDFGAGFPTNQGVHVVLMGDPTLRPFYLLPPSNLTANDDGNGDIALSWDKSPDVEVEGYNVYRSPADSKEFKLINNQPLTTTSFTDMNISEDGNYAYIVRGVKLETTASGSFYNESPGISDTSSVVNAVGIRNFESTAGELKVYPNPAGEILHLESAYNVKNVTIINTMGQIMDTEFAHNSIDIQRLAPGVYILTAFTDAGTQKLRFVVK